MNETSNTSKNTYRIIVAVVIILVIAGIAFAQYKRHNAAISGANSSATSTASTTGLNSTSTPSTIIITTANGGHVVATIDPNNASTTALENAGPQPDLNRAITFSSTTQPDVKVDLTGKIELAEAALKQDPTQFSQWINLGLYREAAGDYVGAQQAWIYAGKLFPNNFISFSDLGDLYSYYLKDLPLALTNLQIAVKNGPTQINLYITESQFYTDFLKDPKDAKAVTQQGLVANPNNPQLEQYLSTLQ